VISQLPSAFWQARPSSFALRPSLSAIVSEKVRQVRFAWRCGVEVGVTAAPVYHHHPHRPAEFDAMPRDMAGQTRAALENLKRGLEAVGAGFADVVKCDRFVTDLADQDALNRVWGEYFGDAKPATTTVQVVKLATDPRCMVEINAVAVIDR